MMVAVLTESRREKLYRRVKWIVGFTIAYNVIEAILALTAGIGSDAISLIGFGLDSTIEVMSAVAVAFMVTRKNPEAFERRTARIVAISFFLLATYVAFESVRSLMEGSAPDHSALGLGIAIASLIIMPGLAWIEYRTGDELGSGAIKADSRQLLLCCYLSGAVVFGLVTNWLAGWWWADPVAGLFIASLAVREGMEAWEGELESPFEVLDELEGDE